MTNQENNNVGWNEENTLILLRCVYEKLQENENRFEKPNADIFYNKIKIKNAGLQYFSWKSMRDKIQALKINYKTTVDWHLNTGILETKDFNPNHITTICPFFKELDKIFGASGFKTLENQTNWNNSQASYSISLQKERSDLNKTALEDDANVEKEKIKLDIRKKECNEFVEKVKFCMDKKKLEIERKKLEQEAMIKLKEIESKERIETLRIKRKFELTKYELELKYKCIKID